MITAAVVSGYFVCHCCRYDYGYVSLDLREDAETIRAMDLGYCFKCFRHRCSRCNQWHKEHLRDPFKPRKCLFDATTFLSYQKALL